MGRMDTKGEIGLGGGRCLPFKDKGQNGNRLPFPVTSGGKKKKKSLAENTTAQVGIIITERKGARLRKEN